jgi:hypothetical protein
MKDRIHDTCKLKNTGNFMVLVVQLYAGFPDSELKACQGAGI